MMDDIKRANGLIVYNHGSECPYCEEFNEHEESGIERNGDYKEACDSCEKEYIATF